jgi:4-oxalocrotonate tautomerase
MPVINVEMAHQTKEKKKEIIEKLTKTMSEITNIPAPAFKILINEYDTESIKYREWRCNNQSTDRE